MSDTEPTKVTVRYDGPKDPTDGTTIYGVPRPGNHLDEVFPLGETVATTKSTANKLALVAGHKFTIKPAQGE